MIDKADIIKILTKYKREGKYYGQNDYISVSNFDDIAEEILGLLDYYYNVQNAELQAKVKVYESIIENSNFKMVLHKKGDGK